MKSTLIQKFGPHINLMKQMGRTLILHCTDEAGKEMILDEQLQIMVEQISYPVPSCQYVPKYQTNLHKYKIRLSLGGLLTADMATHWLKSYEGWDIKEIIIENHPGTSAESGRITMFVKFPSAEHIHNLPESYEAYGQTIKIFHKKTTNTCKTCSALYPDITVPHYEGEECEELRKAWATDQELLKAANELRANRNLNAIVYPVLRVLPENRYLIHSARIEGSQLTFSLQKAQEESKEFSIQLINHEYDYAHLVSILESNEVIEFTSMIDSPITELLQITPCQPTRLKPLQRKNPYRTRRETFRCDLAVQYINIQNGRQAYNNYQIPEIAITNPDILFTAEAGAGDLIEQPNDLQQVVKLTRWGL